MKTLSFSEHLTISVDGMDHQPWEEHRFTVRNCKYIRVLLKRAMPARLKSYVVTCVRDSNVCVFRGREKGKPATLFTQKGGR